MITNNRVLLSNDIVNKVRNNLYGRAGFDHWWDPISEDIKKEIHSELVEIVDAELKKHVS